MDKFLKLLAQCEEELNVLMEYDKLTYSQQSDISRLLDQLYEVAIKIYIK